MAAVSATAVAPSFVIPKDGVTKIMATIAILQYIEDRVNELSSSISTLTEFHGTDTAHRLQLREIEREMNSIDVKERKTKTLLDLRVKDVFNELIPDIKEVLQEDYPAGKALLDYNKKIDSLFSYGKFDLRIAMIEFYVLEQAVQIAPTTKSAAAVSNSVGTATLKLKANQDEKQGPASKMN